jgi:hypothetical protein
MYKNLLAELTTNKEKVFNRTSAGNEWVLKQWYSYVFHYEGKDRPEEHNFSIIIY